MYNVILLTFRYGFQTFECSLHYYGYCILDSTAVQYINRHLATLNARLNTFLTAVAISIGSHSTKILLSDWMCTALTTFTGSPYSHI